MNRRERILEWAFPVRRYLREGRLPSVWWFWVPVLLLVAVVVRLAVAPPSKAARYEGIPPIVQTLIMLTMGVVVCSASARKARRDDLGHRPAPAERRMIRRLGMRAMTAMLLFLVTSMPLLLVLWALLDRVWGAEFGQLLAGAAGGVGMLGVVLGHRINQAMRAELQPPRCLKCGYPLHGLPEPRCPECGTAFDSVRMGHEEPTL